MSSNDNPPTLDLSDIMHHMSPSPVPFEEPPLPPATNSDEQTPKNNRDASPEPISESNIQTIRRRLEEMGLVATRQRIAAEAGESSSSRLISSGNTSSREKELVDMILRLTDVVPVDPAQLEQQATTISRLTAQRDFLVAQAEEERQWWQSEREGWDRMAEALLSQKNRPPKSEDSERQRLAYEMENRTLRERLQDTQRRLSTLEAELIRLKPLLLMQPCSAPRSKHPSTSTQPYKSVPGKGKGKRRENESATHRDSLGPIAEEYGHSEEHGHQQSNSSSPYKLDQQHYTYSYRYQDSSAPQAPHTASSAPAPSSNPKPHTSHPTQPSSQPNTSQQTRRPRDPSSSKSKRHHHLGTTPLSSDAHTEHVLLAAQRIGRKRAAIVTGLQQHAEREKETLAREQEQLRTRREHERMEKERLERLASGTSGMAYYRASADGQHLTTMTSSPQRGGGPRSSASTTMPRTPKRGMAMHPAHYPATLGVGPNNNANPGGVNTPPPSTYVFVNTSATPVPKMPAYTHTPGALGTPGHLGAPVNLIPSSATRQVAKNTNTHGPITSNPPTPLDSLLTAARSMMDDSPSAGGNGDGRGGRGGQGKTNGRRRMLEEPESPVPKRRRVSTDKSAASVGAGTSAVRAGGARLDRVRSALDVLADQAAAAVSNEPGPSGSRASGVGPSTSNMAKGKAKATSRAEAEEEKEIKASSSPEADDGDQPSQESVVSSSSRGRSTASGRSTRTRRGSAVAPAPAPTSTRPVRQSTRKRATSPDRATSTSTSTRGTGRSKGRPKTAGAPSTRQRRGSSNASVARMISPAGPRVITAGPGYEQEHEVEEVAPVPSETVPSPAALPSVPSEADDRDRERAVPMLEKSSDSTPAWGDWGRRDGHRARSREVAHPVEREPSPVEESKDGNGEVVAMEVTPPTEPSADPASLAVEAPASVPDSSEQLPDANPPSAPSPLPNGDLEIKAKSPSPHAPTPSANDIEMHSPTRPDDPEDIDADADAEADLDEDAEGEQEDEEDRDRDGDDDAEIASRDHPSRSRSPPPPDPPPPGPGPDTDGGGPPPPDVDDDEHDADADAEGEMEFDDEEQHHQQASGSDSGSVSASAGTYQAGAACADEVASSLRPGRARGYAPLFAPHRPDNMPGCQLGFVLRAHSRTRSVPVSARRATWRQKEATLPSLFFEPRPSLSYNCLSRSVALS
ncbi:unnamed protein product [Cyclocybe aegerita]|uniref:Uncharacterized protein n=1 Tax=Cyclocybe aegerita TaxID=1973307 RepID=A0A8S0W297_CYCAE|nr:unnamed protein product [Cyclocybe aegerita]